MISNNKEILNIRETCLWLHISQSMLRKLIYDNEIPYFKIGNRYYFEKDIIQQWIISKHNDIEMEGI